jgi:hypothetical protein
LAVIDCNRRRDYHSLMDVKPPSTPRGLGAVGRAFWRQMVGTYSFDPAELGTLRRLCKTMSETVELEECLAETGPLIKGSRCQPVINPVVAALVVHRKLEDQLTLSLGLPVEGEQFGKRRTAAARAAADSGLRKTKLTPRVKAIQTKQQRDRGA